MNHHSNDKKNTELTHPPEWEALLEDVTHPQDWRETLRDPRQLANLTACSSYESFTQDTLKNEWEEISEHQIETVKRIAQRKLKGLVKNSILLLLSTGYGYKRLSELLHVHEDSVLRAVKRGIQQIREHLDAEHFGEFPIDKGKRPALRARVFPLDNPKEKNDFVHFLNKHIVVHLSYRGDDLFKEAMVVYLTGRPVNKVGRFYGNPH